VQDFLCATDEQLASGHFRQYQVTHELQQHISAELVRKMIAMHSGSSVTSQHAEELSPEIILTQLFEQMDRYP
jgi:hypothetical protein